MKLLDKLDNVLFKRVNLPLLESYWFFQKANLFMKPLLQHISNWRGLKESTQQEANTDRRQISNP